MKNIFSWVLTVIDALVGIFVIYATIGQVFRGNILMLIVLVLGLVVTIRLFVTDLTKALNSQKALPK